EKVTAGDELLAFIEQVRDLGGSICAEDAIAENRLSVPFVHPSPADELTRRLRTEWDPQRRLYWRGDKQ
ncbi:MAG: hypothetical protein AAEJ04_02740, partial [Planctomycetota bacterium]